MSVIYDRVALIGLGLIAAGVAFSRRGGARRSDGLSADEEAAVEDLIAQFDAEKNKEQDKT